MNPEQLIVIDRSVIEALAKEYLFNDFQNKYVVDTNDVQFGVLKGFIEGYTQAIQSRVVNVSDKDLSDACDDKEKYYLDKLKKLKNLTPEFAALCCGNSFELGAKWMRSKLSQKSEKDMDEFAVGFAEWIRKNEYLYTSFENHWYKSYGDNHYTDFTEQELLTTYKESITHAR